MMENSPQRVEENLLKRRKLVVSVYYLIIGMAYTMLDLPTHDIFAVPAIAFTWLIIIDVIIPQPSDVPLIAPKTLPGHLNVTGLIMFANGLVLSFYLTQLSDSFCTCLGFKSNLLLSIFTFVCVLSLLPALILILGTLSLYLQKSGKHQKSWLKGAKVNISISIVWLTILWSYFIYISRFY